MNGEDNRLEQRIVFGVKWAVYKYVFSEGGGLYHEDLVTIIKIGAKAVILLSPNLLSQLK